MATPCQLATLEMGLRYERAMTAFWTELLADDGADDGASLSDGHSHSIVPGGFDVMS